MHKDQKTSKNLNYYLVKIQKPLVLSLFLIMVVAFVYSLVYMTPFYGIYEMEGKPIEKEYLEHYGVVFSVFENDPAYQKALQYNLLGTKVIGLNTSFFIDFTHSDLQSFNHWMFNMGFIGICISLLLFVYFSQKRKRYYITNFISFLIVLCFDFYVGISLLIKTINCQQIVSNARFDIINIAQTLRLNNDTTSIPEKVTEYFSAASTNWIFILGYVIAAIIIILSICGVLFLASKFNYQRKQKEIDTSEVVINE